MTAFFQVHFVFFLTKLYRKSLKHSNFYVAIWTILNRHITRHKRKFPAICTNMSLYSQRQIKNIFDRINIDSNYRWILTFSRNKFWVKTLTSSCWNSSCLLLACRLLCLRLKLDQEKRITNCQDFCHATICQTSV